MARRASASLTSVAPRERGERCGDLPTRHDLAGESLDRLSADLELLAHPVRLRILDMLVRRGGEVCVCDLERALPIKQPTVSHHLRLLREAGWVDTVRKGVWAYYFVRPGVLGAVRERLRGVVEWLA